MAITASSAVAQTVPPSSVGSIDSLTAFAERASRRPLAWGESWDPGKDPDGESRYLFLVGADSTIWLEAPDGTTSLTDAYVAVNIARTTAERTGYTETLRETNLRGFGREDGRVFLYLRQGAEVYTAAGLLLLVVGGTVALVGWLVHRLRRERRQRRQLSEVNHRLVEARENERLRIAQDLHDGPVQDLNIVNLHLAAARSRVAVGGGEARTGGLQNVADLQTEVISVVREIRTIAEDLRPPTLGPFGLAAALRSHAERFNRLHPSIRVRLDLADDGQELPEGVRLALFRIVQEAMTNAAKHARPAEVTVLLRLDANSVCLEVVDDGAGYSVPADPADLSPPGHYGLLGMGERAEAVGARLEVRSVPGRGTTIRVKARRDAPEWSRPSMQNKL